MQKMRNCADLCVEIIDQRSTVSNGADGFAEPLQIGFDSRQIHSQRNQQLHDSVGQLLGALGMNLSTVKADLERLCDDIRGVTIMAGVVDLLWFVMIGCSLKDS